MPEITRIPGGSGQSFQWYEYFGAREFAAGDIVELNLAIIPFEDAGLGTTVVGLDAEGGNTFLALTFNAGFVNGRIPYDSEAWNLVTASLDYGNQKFRLAVNGVVAGPFPFSEPSMSIQSFRVNYFGPGTERRMAWFDSLLLASPAAVLLEVDFDEHLPGSDSACWGCTLEPAQPGDDGFPPCCTSNIRPPTRQDGLAGRAETVFNLATPGQQYFEWYQPFGVRQVGLDAGLELTFYILPFAGEGVGATQVGLDDGDGGTIFSIAFQEGLVNRQIPYNPTNWNAVTATLDFAGQTYTVRVNGAGTEPAPFRSPSTSVRALRVNYAHPGLRPAVAWLDSITLRSDAESFLNVDFDRSLPALPDPTQGGGRLTIEDPVLAGSNPSVEQERPRLMIERRGRGIALSWNATQTRQVLQVSESVAGPWREVAEPAHLDGAAQVVEIQSTPSPSFFRLASWPNP